MLKQQWKQGAVLGSSSECNIWHFSVQGPFKGGFVGSALTTNFPPSIAIIMPTKQKKENSVRSLKQSLKKQYLNLQVGEFFFDCFSSDGDLTSKVQYNCCSYVSLLTLLSVKA